MNLTLAQKLGLTIGILGILATATTQLTDILAPFGSYAPIIVKEIVSVAGLATSILGFVLTFVTGQGSQVANVQAMPGVKQIVVNENASPVLATMAVDPANPKIAAAPEAKAAVQATAIQAAS